MEDPRPLIPSQRYVDNRGSASYRRRLMDMVLTLIVPAYASKSTISGGIKQKTVILRNGGRTDLIDRALLPLASWMKMRERRRYL